MIKLNILKLCELNEGIVLLKWLISLFAVNGMSASQMFVYYFIMHYMMFLKSYPLYLFSITYHENFNVEWKQIRQKTQNIFKCKKLKKIEGNFWLWIAVQGLQLNAGFPARPRILEKAWNFKIFFKALKNLEFYENMENTWTTPGKLST